MLQVQRVINAKIIEIFYILKAFEIWSIFYT
jgi:hypothetical protein